jgi:hypothetical protein
MGFDSLNPSYFRDVRYFRKPAASTTGVHFAISFAMYVANSAGVPPIGSRERQAIT